MMQLFRARPRALRSTGSLLRAGYTSRKPRSRTQSYKPLGPRSSSRRPPQPISPSKRRDVSPNAAAARSDEAPPQSVSSLSAISSALRDSTPQENNLLAPVHIPEDTNAVLRSDHPAASILGNSSLVVTRQLELMNVMLGFEQANKYVIMDGQGNHIGFMAERDLGMGNMMARQMFSTHRSFTTHVFDTKGVEVLRFHRPFSWISSRIGVYDAVEEGHQMGGGGMAADRGLVSASPGALSTQVEPSNAQISHLPLEKMRVIGEAQQQWAPLRRKYNLFLNRSAASTTSSEDAPQLTSGSVPLSNNKALTAIAPSSSDQGQTSDYAQFAYIDEPFLSWDFSLLSQNQSLLGSVNRNFVGFGREIFTDTGVYALRMDAATLAQEPEHHISKTGRGAEVESKGMTLDQRAVMLATAVSVDFDYFSRKSRGGMGGGFFPLWFPGMGGGGAGGAEAGGAVEGAEGAEGAGAAEEGAMVGAGGAAGYEAMQRGTYGDEASPTDGQVDQGYWGQGPPAGQQPGGQGEDVWDQGNDPWSGNQSGGGGSGGGGDGGDGLDLGDWF